MLLQSVITLALFQQMLKNSQQYGYVHNSPRSSQFSATLLALYAATLSSYFCFVPLCSKCQNLKVSQRYTKSYAHNLPRPTQLMPHCNNIAVKCSYYNKLQYLMIASNFGCLTICRSSLIFPGHVKLSPMQCTIKLFCQYYTLDGSTYEWAGEEEDCGCLPPVQP